MLSGVCLTIDMSDTEEQPTKKLKLNKDELPGLPAGAKPLSHQVAGHASTGGTQSQKKGTGFFSSHYCDVTEIRLGN